MSTMIMAQCWPLQMPPTPKAVLISLADNANDQGYCWPSLTTICERTCFGRTAVIDAIKWLEKYKAVKADRTDRYKTTYNVTPAAFAAGELVHEGNQSGRRTSSDDGGLVRLPDNEVRETDDEVRQADTNRQEPSLTVNKSKRQRTRSATPPIEVTLPPWLPPDVWDAWVSDRKERKQPLTQRAAELAIEALGRLRAEGWPPKKVIDNAIELGWRGLFAPKQNSNGGTHATRSSGSAGGVGDDVQRAIDERQAREQDGRRSSEVVEGTCTAGPAG
ncbi:hypothetical protein DyAD56_15990 [Dyella sp. AD56]|uniref:helix-turn-helix domain-containing protein n=1 Tax=Dyella sp. AD56 TaxID=1528744 RepID=UPI000C81D9C1|nr:helix-turn-helix domain-containing protein [Dyella sp. AD56]PMQ04189.1 hypothetical protein DyAD56_15990 [Dyella sp. AD56]